MTNRETDILELQERISLFEDENAYKQLFLRLFPSLCGFSQSITRSRELSEEIVSDLFINVWAGRKTLMNIKDLRTYLFVSTRNLSIKALNKENRKNFLQLDQLGVDFVSDYASPEDQTRFNELNQTIGQAIRELPPRCQLVFKLAKEDKLRHKEISELLNISIKTIDNQLAIALKKIGASLSSHLFKKNI